LTYGRTEKENLLNFINLSIKVVAVCDVGTIGYKFCS